MRMAKLVNKARGDFVWWPWRAPDTDPFSFTMREREAVLISAD
ncbi:hypothetical protein [Xanthomonas citri]|nr:hypothetical protein [Xanthomonas citri]